MAITRLNRTRLRAAALATTTALVVGMTATSAHAFTPDTTAPQAQSYSVDHNSFNLSRGDATFTVTLRVTDETGLDRTSGLFNPADPVILVSHTTTDQSHGFGGMTLVSGDAKDGIYEKTVTIPQGAADGTWEVTLYPLSDTLGNSTDLGEFEFFGTLATITTVYDQPAVPTAPEFVDENGPDDDVVVIPEVTGVDYDINGEPAAAGEHAASGLVEVVASAEDDYFFLADTVSSWSHSFDAITAVVPEPVVFTDESGTSRDSYSIPESDGVSYYVNEATVATAAGTYPGEGTVAISARAQDEFTIADGAQASWTHEFSTEVMPVTTATPAIEGTPTVNSTLTALPGTWGPAGVVLSYQWNADGTPITGATGTTLALTADHVGKAITVTVTGTQDGYTTASRDSDPTAKITAPEVPVEPEEPVTPVTFNDVTEKSWFFAPVTWMVEREITTGYSDGTFKPYKPVTRGEVVTFLYRYADEDFKAPQSVDLKDVPPTHNFYEAISWATSNGVVNGYKDKTFRSSKNMTRAEVAAVLYRQADPEHTAPAESPFKDLTPESNQYEAITWLAQQEITTGRADDTFDPGANVTRAEIAAFLDRYNTVLTQ